MNIDELKLRNKNILVERAISLYKIKSTKKEISEWVKFLTDGNEFEEMIHCLKTNKQLKKSKKDIEPIHFSCGCVKLIDNDLECYASGRRNFWIEINNNSSSVWETTDTQPLYIAYHWYNNDESIYEFDSKRSSLSKAIMPGESLNCEMLVITPTTPGHYFLEATMVLEGNYWMEDNQLSIQKVPIKVEEYNGDGLTRHAKGVYQELKRATMREAS